jgi:hypothetical protein
MKFKVPMWWTWNRCFSVSLCKRKHFFSTSLQLLNSFRSFHFVHLNFFCIRLYFTKKSTSIQICQIIPIPMYVHFAFSYDNDCVCQKNRHFSIFYGFFSGKQNANLCVTIDKKMFIFHELCLSTRWIVSVKERE